MCLRFEAEDGGEKSTQSSLLLPPDCSTLLGLLHLLVRALGSALYFDVETPFIANEGSLRNQEDEINTNLRESRQVYSVYLESIGR